MARKSKARIPSKVKLAAALLTILRPDSTGQLVPVISYEESKRLGPDEIIARFDFDHGVHEAIDGPTAPWNLTPRPRREHRAKTSAVDIPQIAKTKRLAKAHVDHEGVMLAKVGAQSPDAIPEAARASRTKATGRKMLGRGFPKGQGRPLKSAGFRKPDRPAKIPRFSPEKIR